jgi:hypothetical protein
MPPELTARWARNRWFQSGPRCLLLALFGHPDGPDQCPVLGLDRTWPNHAAMSQIGPNSDIARPLNDLA